MVITLELTASGQQARVRPPLGTLLGMPLGRCERPATRSHQRLLVACSQSSPPPLIAFLKEVGGREYSTPEASQLPTCRAWENP